MVGCFIELSIALEWRMSVRIPFAALAIMMLLPLVAFAQGVKADPDLAEAAYVNALRSASTLAKDRDAAKAEAEARRREYKEKRTDILNRQKAASSSAEGRLTEASLALEAHRTRLPAVEAKAKHEQDLESVRSLLGEREIEAKASQEAFVQAQSQISVLKVEIERAQSRIEAAGKEIEQERGRVERLDAGDAAELDALARRAVQEREEVAAILQEFTPAFLAATMTARIAVGIHLPTLYKAKQSIDRVKTNFCGTYTERARNHIRYAIDGMTRFLERDETMAGVSLAMAKESEPKESDAACDVNLAEVGRDEARQRIAAAQTRISEDKAAIRPRREALSLAQSVLAKGTDAVAEAERPAQEARARVVALEARGEAMKAVWEADLHQQKAEHDARRHVLEDAKAAARAEYDAALAPFVAELAALTPAEDADSRFNELNEKADRADRDAADMRRAFLAAVAKDDIQRQLQLSVTVGQDIIGHPEMCIKVVNKGDFAVKDVALFLRLNGKPVPPGVTSTLQFFPNYSAAKTGDTPIAYRYQSVSLGFSGTNRYAEQVPYLMPGKSSGSACADLSDLFRGESLRALDAAGQGRVSASQFGLAIDDATIADPTKETRSSGTVTYAPIYLRERYHDRLQRAADKANDGVISASAKASPAAAPVPDPEAVKAIPAVLGRDQAIKVQKALIAAGHLTGKADGAFGGRSVEAVRRWQSVQGFPSTGQLTAPQVEALIGR